MCVCILWWNRFKFVYVIKVEATRGGGCCYIMTRWYASQTWLLTLYAFILSDGSCAWYLLFLLKLRGKLLLFFKIFTLRKCILIIWLNDIYGEEDFNKRHVTFKSLLYAVNSALFVNIFFIVYGTQVILVLSLSRFLSTFSFIQSLKFYQQILKRNPLKKSTSFISLTDSSCTSIGNGCFLAEPSCKGLESFFKKVLKPTIQKLYAINLFFLIVNNINYLLQTIVLSYG